MYCSKCGSELPPEAAFCSKCGSRVWQQPGEVTTQTERSNPPGGMGQNGSSTWTPPQEPDLGYTRIFGYAKVNVVLDIVFTSIFLIFIFWFCNEIEDISYSGRYDGYIALLGLLIIAEIILAVYRIIHTTKIRLEVERDRIDGRGKVGIAGSIWGTTRDVVLSYKDVDSVEPSMGNPDAAIKILSGGEWYQFSVENGKEAFDLIRQRWQAARR